MDDSDAVIATVRDYWEGWFDGNVGIVAVRRSALGSANPASTVTAGLRHIGLAGARAWAAGTGGGQRSGSSDRRRAVR
jgi:hypothetical protein